MEIIWRIISVFLNKSAVGFLFSYVVSGWFIWLPVLLVYLFWRTWLNYIRIFFIRNTPWVLLEIKIPREIMRSPKAIEVVLNALHNTRDGNRWERYWKGFLRVWYSMEIISIGGQIHFFIYAQKGLRNFVESQIYSQYPGAEISEADDYSQIISPKDISESGGDWGVWGAEFFLVKEDAYPIRTYVDFGLEASRAKEEEKIDPLTSFLESLGSLQEGEQIWFQMLVRPATDVWKEKAEDVIEELQHKKGGAAEDVTTGFTMLSPGQREVLMAVEHNVAKLGYETGIRVVYLAKKEIFSVARNSIVSSSMKQYSTQNMNSFKPKTTSANYFFVEQRKRRKKRKLLRGYQERSWFYMPYCRPTYVLNTESLATIYHFPGRVATTPTLGRIESKRGEPPIDLPI